MELMSWLLAGDFALVRSGNSLQPEAPTESSTLLTNTSSFCSFSRRSITITARNFLDSRLKNLWQAFPIKRWLHIKRSRTWQSS